MTRKIFITGTGTDVGKTVVTRGIVRALVNAGTRLCALKPVESGVPMVQGIPQPNDGLALQGAAKTDGPLEEVCRYMFSKPVSPHLAARLENRSIDAKEVKLFLQQAEQKCDVLVVEGAGGLLVPLSDQLLYADFIAEMGYELVVVAPNILGTINATLLTIEAAKSRNIPVAGVVLNQGGDDSFGNAEAIERFGNVPVLGTFPEVHQFDDEVLATAANEHLDMNAFSGKDNQGSL